jgi:hypothetical protein
MKTRQSFVANSSSSSFIIGVSAIPNTIGEFGDIVFGRTKEYVAPIIMENLFSGLTPFPLDLNKLRSIAQNIKCINRVWEEAPKFAENEYDDITMDNEWKILYKLSTHFSFRYDDTDYDNYIDKRVRKILTKQFPNKSEEELDRYSEYDIPDMKRFEIINDYFKLKRIKENFLLNVESFIHKIQGYQPDKFTNFLYGTFCDEDGSLGSELEHGGHWDKINTAVRFSNH